MQEKSNNKLAFTAMIILVLLISGVSGVVATCGNGGIEVGEVCDGAALDDKTCPDFGYEYGALSCCSDCKNFGLSGCYSVNTGACFDGDNGNNYYVFSNASQFVSFDRGEPCPAIEAAGDIGPCEGGDWIVEDACEGDILHEAVCNKTTGMPNIVDYDCSSEEKECTDGACAALGVCENCGAGERCLEGQCVTSQPPNKSLLKRIMDWIFNLG